MSTVATPSTSLKTEAAEGDSKYIGANTPSHSKKTSSCVKSFRAIKPPHERLCLVPRPPDDAGIIKRFYFYGWYVETKWLSDFARKNKVTPISSPPHRVSDAIRYLSHKVGFLQLRLVGGLVEGNESFGEVFPGRYPGEKAIPVLAICVNAQHLVHMRPTRHQLEQYIKIFEREPRWFKDAGKLSDFHMYDFPTPTDVAMGRVQPPVV